MIFKYNKMKNIIKTTILLLFITTLISFYKINNNNYNKYKEVKKSFVKHPENLPTKNTAINTSF
jgi:hypothetical protein